eukprot:scaffold80573_cov55-Phaeocystis_antarctica.AAC.1
MKTFAWKTSASVRASGTETRVRWLMAADSTGATGGAGGVARRTVVGLGGDEDGGDEEAVDVVVRRAEGRAVLLAEPGEG